MLYKTHQRYGLFSGIIGIPLLVSLGMIPIITKDMRFTDAVMVMFMVVYAILYALFGSEFPDCDSYGGKMENGEMKKGSIPSQKHPLISKIFRLCGVKHRGKFSHDYASILGFFSLLYFLQYIAIKTLNKLLVGVNSSTVALVIQLIAILLIINLGREIAIKYKFIKKNRKKPNVNFNTNVIWIGTVIGVYILTTLVGFTSLNVMSVENAYNTLPFIATILKVIVIFGFFGAYSHLFADMLTNEGVSIFGFRLSPAKLVIKINQFFFIPLILFGGIGFFISQVQGLITGLVIGFVLYIAIKKTDLKTGSAYEDVCYLIVTILCVPATILAIISITGGDVQAFLSTLGFM